MKHIGAGIQVTLKLRIKSWMIGWLGSHQTVNIGIVDGSGGVFEVVDFCTFQIFSTVSIGIEINGYG